MRVREKKYNLYSASLGPTILRAAKLMKDGKNQNKSMRYT